jgi:hypothetical protein
MNQDIPFSDADYYFFRRERYAIQYVFRYAKRIDEDRLRKALLLTGAALPPLGARLVPQGPRALALRPGHGVPLRAQSVARVPDPSALVDPVRNLSGEPLVKVVLSRAPEGDFVGFSFSHFLGDGASFFLFLRSLVAFLHGEAPPPAHFGRSCLQGPPGGAGRPELFPVSGYVLPRLPDLPPAAPERICFGKEELSAARARAESHGMILSENALMMAALAKRFRTQIPLYEGKFLVRCPVDYRARLGLPAGYFGNAVLDAVAAFTPGEMQAFSEMEIARRITDAIRAVTPARIARHLANLRRLREEEGPSIFEEISCPGLLVSNLTKLPFAGIDLGAGPPVGVFPASLNPRLAVVLPGEDAYEVRIRPPLSAPAKVAELSAR